jgi:uncharacterized membrane protein YdjX (TVP38/TMEM64 family)
MGSFARLGLLALFVVVAAVIAAASGLASRFELGALRDLFLAHPVQGTFAYIVLFCLGGLLRIPGLVFLFAAVLALGRELGGVLTYLAAIVACSLSFVVIRSIGGDVLRRLRWRWVQRIFSHIDRRPVLSVFVLRSVLMVAPPLNYALALSGIRFRHYWIGTLLGLPLPIAVCSIFSELIMRMLGLPA